jgi:hypothetical protein
MKKILSLIFGVLIALPALCQVDSVFLFSTGQGVLGDSIILPTDFYRRGAAVPKLLKIGLRKAKAQTINMGMDAMYIPETDLVGGNVTRSLAKIITYQIPLSVQVTQAQLDSISKYIKKITEPVVVPKPDIITSIDDAFAAPGVKYYTIAAGAVKLDANTGLNVGNPGGWSHAANNAWNTAHHDKTASYTSIVNSFVEITFTGYKFEWVTEKRLNHGIAAVSIDGGAEVEIDLYDPTSLNTKIITVFASPALSSGTHVIKIRCTGKKNPAATETNILHDRLVVYKKTP